MKNNNKQHNNKTHTTILAVVLSIVAIILFCALLIPTNNNNKNENNQKLEISNLKMTADYNSILDDYIVTITGLAKNNTTKDYSYVSLKFSIYDTSGNKIDTAWTNINYLASGETWNFEMTAYVDVQPQSCKLADITAW